MGEAFGLYTHIRNTRWRSGFLIASLFVLVAVITFAFTLIIESQMQGGPLDAIVARTAARTCTSAATRTARSAAFSMAGSSTCRAGPWSCPTCPRARATTAA